MRQSEIQTNNYTLREERKDGKNYIVVPVVMMREGVHIGSHGAIYHTAEELGKDIEKWNGIPITIYHPKEGDTYISANSPGVQAVGRVYNVRMVEDKLMGDAWLTEQKMMAASPQALEHIRALLPLDVSVGIYSEELAISGEWNGETYNAQALNYRPDHLALLPGGEGSCSWADGCGIRANEKQETVTIAEEELTEELTPQNNHDINEQTNEMEKTTCCPELLAKVIQSNHRLSEADKDWLSMLETPQLEKLLPEITEEQVTGYIAGLEQNKVINLLPEQLQANVKSAIEAREKLRSDKIAEIMSNSGEIWTKEDLEAMPCATLEKISKSLQPGNYAAQGGNKTPEVKGEAPLLPPMVK